jgi:protein-S-isoprenylcysteine O-methyltransferase Ste14
MLKKEFVKQGNWLFRWRSYLPLLILPILFLAIRETEHSEQFLGQTLDYYYKIFCILVSILGMVVRFMVIGFVPKGTSGRNTRQQVANTLNVSGMYSLVRHPLYLGNFLISLGIVMFVEVWWFVLIYMLAFWIYYERIMFAEEEYISEKFGESYLKWSENTPAFIPKFSGWKSSSLHFSVKNIIKREISGFLAIIVSFTLLDFIEDIISTGIIKIETSSKIVLSIGLLVFLLVVILIKKTRIFSVDGR